MVHGYLWFGVYGFWLMTYVSWQRVYGRDESDPRPIRAGLVHRVPAASLSLSLSRSLPAHIPPSLSLSLSFSLSFSLCPSVSAESGTGPPRDGGRLGFKVWDVWCGA